MPMITRTTTSTACCFMRAWRQTVMEEWPSHGPFLSNHRREETSMHFRWRMNFRCSGSMPGMALALTLATVQPLPGQRIAADTNTNAASAPTQGTVLFTSRDWTYLMGASLVSIEVGHYDTKIARYTQT